MQNLQKKLIDILKDDTTYYSNEKLLKNKLTEDALKLEPKLVKYILSDDKLKKHFFLEVDGVLVFDKDKFIQFVNDKQFLPDSYTSFKNKIGLLDENSDYFREKKDVVLAWPYKDCVLEGGQDKEDQKRDEIFYNEILAPDEIDRLFDSKVLTNFKRYDKDGEHPNPNDVIRNDNLIIKGNNLLALHSLKKLYRGKVKLIYIDPPYNIGNDDSFNYNDRFNHSTWLTFMFNRLEIAKELLQNKGLIFIHIGDLELHYLKVLADDVFGRDNFIATVPRKTRSGKSDVPYKFSQDFDWMIVYTKNSSKTEELFQRTVDRKYYKSDDFPNDEWRLTDITTQRTIRERPNSNFTLINPRNGDKFPVNPNRCWGITKDSVDNYLKRKKIVFPGDYSFLKIEQPAMRVFKSEEIQKRGEDFDKSYVSTDFLNQIMDDLLKKTTNQKGTDEIKDLFGEKIFSYPKNELLLHKIIEYTTKENDVICDFFLGSGTTVAVAHKMNRRYIGIEQMNYIDHVTIERLKKVINGEQGGISKDVKWQGGGSFVYCELRKWNQNYIDEIESAKTSEELLSIYDKMKSEAFFRYDVDLSKFDEKEFKELTLEQQKEILIECLDKNHLYVNLSEMEDATYQISEEEKKMNRKFYGV